MGRHRAAAGGVKNPCKWCRNHGYFIEFNYKHRNYECIFVNCECDLCARSFRPRRTGASNPPGRNLQPAPALKKACSFCKNHGRLVQPSAFHSDTCEYRDCLCKRCSDVRLSLPVFCVFCKNHNLKHWEKGRHAEFCKLRSTCHCQLCSLEREKDLKTQSNSKQPERSAVVNTQKSSHSSTENDIGTESQENKDTEAKCNLTPSSNVSEKGVEACVKRKRSESPTSTSKLAKLDTAETVLPDCQFCANHSWKFPLKEHHKDVCMYAKCGCNECRMVRKNTRTKFSKETSNEDIMPCSTQPSTPDDIFDSDVAMVKQLPIEPEVNASEADSLSIPLEGGNVSLKTDETSARTSAEIETGNSVCFEPSVAVKPSAIVSKINCELKKPCAVVSPKPRGSLSLSKEEKLEKEKENTASTSKAGVDGGFLQDNVLDDGNFVVCDEWREESEPISPKPESECGLLQMQSSQGSDSLKLLSSESELQSSLSLEEKTEHGKSEGELLSEFVVCDAWSAEDESRTDSCSPTNLAESDSSERLIENKEDEHGIFPSASPDKSSPVSMSEAPPKSFSPCLSNLSDIAAKKIKLDSCDQLMEEKDGKQNTLLSASPDRCISPIISEAHLKSHSPINVADTGTKKTESDSCEQLIKEKDRKQGISPSASPNRSIPASALEALPESHACDSLSDSEVSVRKDKVSIKSAEKIASGKDLMSLSLTLQRESAVQTEKEEKNDVILENTQPSELKSLNFDNEKSPDESLPSNTCEKASNAAVPVAVEGNLLKNKELNDRNPICSNNEESPLKSDDVEPEAIQVTKDGLRSSLERSESQAKLGSEVENASSLALSSHDANKKTHPLSSDICSSLIAELAKLGENYQQSVPYSRILIAEKYESSALTVLNEAKGEKQHGSRVDIFLPEESQKAAPKVLSEIISSQGSFKEDDSCSLRQDLEVTTTDQTDLDSGSFLCDVCGMSLQTYFEFKSHERLHTKLLYNSSGSDMPQIKVPSVTSKSTVHFSQESNKCLDQLSSNVDASLLGNRGIKRKRNLKEICSPEELHTLGHEKPSRDLKQVDCKELNLLCHVCGTSFETVDQLRFHGYFKHEMDVESCPTKMYNCQSCEFRSVNEIALMDHESFHMGVVSLSEMLFLLSSVNLLVNRKVL